MKILHVIAAIQKAAGTSVFCCELCNELVRRGHDVTIAVSIFNIKEWYPTDSRVKIVNIQDVVRSGKQFDIIHIHGLWQYVVHQGAAYARRHGIPYVWSPHGALTPWAMAHKRWKKLPVWLFWQKWDIVRAAALHVTAQKELDGIRKLGLTNSAVIAPLGIHWGGNAESRRFGGNGCRRFTFVGRVYPVKGLDLLLKAFARCRRDGWVVRIVGPDQEGYTAVLKALADELGILSLVEFAGPKYGELLRQEYVDADCFVLPSYSENFGSVVIEALSAGTPVITTKETPWKDLEARGCGLWVDATIDAITDAMKIMTSKTDDERITMGRLGRKLVEEHYTWSAVCDEMLQGYVGILSARDSQ